MLKETMISSSPAQANGHPVFVMDASVAINLLGSGRPADLLHAFDRHVVIEEKAYNEVLRNSFDGGSGKEGLDALASAGLLHLERLSSEGYELFLELTGAEPPVDLGDGEAATIAHSIVMEGIPLLDERKGSRIARERGLHVMSTVDFLRSDQILEAMSKSELADTIYAALKNARMRVPCGHRQWVVDAIGPDRAALCSSLGSLIPSGDVR